MTSGELIFAVIFLVCFIIIAGVVMVLSRTIEHGEARFDTRNRSEVDEDAQ